MDDKDLFEQVIGREVGNLLGKAGPAFKLLTPTVTSYIMNAIDVYIDAFISPDTGKINTKAGEAYVKQEINKKIEDFVRNFEEQSNRNGDLQ